MFIILFLPPYEGSHNAITYCLDMNDRSPVDLTQPDMLQKLDKYMKPLIRPFVYKWAVTQVRKSEKRTHRLVVTQCKNYVVLSRSSSVLQEFTIKHQLDCGVRYCDLRIAHRPNDSSTDLYFYHGVYTTLTVEVKLRHADVFVLLRLIFTALCGPFASTAVTIKITIENGSLAVTRRWKSGSPTRDRSAVFFFIALCMKMHWKCFRRLLRLIVMLITQLSSSWEARWREEEKKLSPVQTC